MRWNDYLSVTDLPERIGETVTLSGWVHHTRKSGKIRFLLLRESSTLLQCVLVKGELEEKYFNLFPQLAQETCVTVTGKVQATPKNHPGVELVLTSLEIISEAHDFPITPKEHGTDFLHSHRHLWLRSRKQLAIFAIRDEIIRAIRDFFHENRFVLMDSPILTSCIGEDPAGLFSTDYFDLGKAYLAQTGQLYLEASIFAHNRVYCFGPTFRAEKSKTRRHLTEFWMVEAEMAFFDNNDNMDVQEDMVQFLIGRVLKNCTWHLQQLERDPEVLKKTLHPFKRIDYSDAVPQLQAKNSEIQWGDDLGAGDESMLVAESEVPVFVYNYPKKAKAFYMKENPENPETVLCADLLAPEGFGEIIGGSQREDSFERLKQRIREDNLPQENYEWYLDLRKYGSVTHSGFGLGIERFVGWVCGLPHIREVIPFPRMIGRLTP